MLDNNNSINTLEDITNDLLSYALYHFETEENLMNKNDYSSKQLENSMEHIEQHRNFAHTVVEVKNNMKSGKPITKDELLNFLKNWLTNHILFTDKKLGAFLTNK
jgi:hemerythrin-like metal-binding protein